MSVIKEKDVYRMMRLILVGFILMVLSIGLSLGMGLTKMTIEIRDLTVMGLFYVLVLGTIGASVIGFAAMKLRKFGR